MLSHPTYLWPYSLNLNGKLWSIDAPKIMGILNITPNSFFDGGKYLLPHQALHQAESMLSQGAHILDLGAASSKPGAQFISETEEWQRLEAVLKPLKQNFPNAIVSIDTWRSSIAQKAIDLGAHIINDISGGQLDPAMFKTVASARVPYILMHMQGIPANMQQAPAYKNVVSEQFGYFAQKIETLRELGQNDIILDPGFGFGKTTEHNYQILKSLSHYQIFELPVLVGLSRKRMVCEPLGIQAQDALNGTTALHMLALQQGAHFLRVHDVEAAQQAIKLFLQFQAAPDEFI